MTEEQAKAIHQLKMDYNHAFGTEGGKRVLDDLRRRCYKYMPTYTGEPSGTLINEGKRMVLLTIESIMELNVDELAKMEESGKI